MSRIGKQPIVLPNGVEATVDGSTITVKGPNGTLTTPIHDKVEVAVNEVDGAKQIEVNAPDLSKKFYRSIWGTMRSLIQNMVTGVTDGFTKQLEVNGVGYKVSISGRKLNLSLGYSHDIDFELPEGVTGEVEKNVITLKGADKQLVGHTAAEIRKLRKPEPYKGKGIKYMDEVIRRKAGKAAKAA